MPAQKGLDEGFRGADDGIRTRDPHLGKVMLYQLSHVRVEGQQGSKRAAESERRTDELDVADDVDQSWGPPWCGQRLSSAPSSLPTRHRAIERFRPEPSSPPVVELVGPHHAVPPLSHTGTILCAGPPVNRVYTTSPSGTGLGG